MQPHQERVLQEKKELDEKIAKLTSFIESDKFEAVDKTDKNLLVAQLDYMNGYSHTLQQRINRF